MQLTIICQCKKIRYLGYSLRISSRVWRHSVLSHGCSWTLTHLVRSWRGASGSLRRAAQPAKRRQARRHHGHPLGAPGISLGVVYLVRGVCIGVSIDRRFDSWRFRFATELGDLFHAARRSGAGGTRQSSSNETVSCNRTMTTET